MPKALINLFSLSVSVNDITPEERKQMRLKFKSQIGAHSRAQNVTQLHERLKLKLAELRGGDANAQKGRRKKKKLTKAEKKLKAREEKKLKAKLARADHKNGGQMLNVPGGAKPAKPVYNNDGKMVFSKFDFGNGECAIGNDDGTGAKKQSLDPKAALGKIQKHKEKIKSLQAIGKALLKYGQNFGLSNVYLQLFPHSHWLFFNLGKTERIKNIEEKVAWKSAMEKAEGVKLKDDETLLKKTIKRMDQKKKSSKRKWDARVESEDKRKSTKQQKRSDNIKKRKQDKKHNLMKKASKKGRSVPGF